MHLQLLCHKLAVTMFYIFITFSLGNCNTMAYGLLNQHLSLHYCNQRPPEKWYKVPDETVIMYHKWFKLAGMTKFISDTLSSQTDQSQPYPPCVNGSVIYCDTV